MTDRILINPADIHTYQEYVRNRGRSLEAYGDAVFMRLFRAYVTSKEAYVQEYGKASAVVVKNYGRPGPRRQADLAALSTARRFFERDAYNYFSFQPCMTMANPFETTHNIVRGHLKDASIAQQLRDDDRVNQSFQAIAERVEVHCKAVYEAYRREQSSPSASMLYSVVRAGELVDHAELTTPYAMRIRSVIEELFKSGQLKGAFE